MAGVLQRGGVMVLHRREWRDALGRQRYWRARYETLCGQAQSSNLKLCVNLSSGPPPARMNIVPPL